MNPEHPNFSGSPPGPNQKFINYTDPTYVQGSSRPMATSVQAPPIRAISNPIQQIPAYGYAPFPFINNGLQHQPLFAQESAHASAFTSQTAISSIGQQMPPVNGNTGLNQEATLLPNRGLGGIDSTILKRTRSFSSASHYSSEVPVSNMPSPQPKVVIVDQTKPSSKLLESHLNAGTVSKTHPLRKRSSTACDTCRQKKIKCDNVKPRCGACSRSNTTFCHYSSEVPGSEAWLSEASYSDITSKLDIIMDELRSRGQEASAGASKRRKVQASMKKSSQHWDASFTSLLKWPYLQQQLGIDSQEIPRHTSRLVSAFSVSNLPVAGFSSVKQQFDATSEVEEDFHKNFGSHINAFLINSHTKIPFLDIVQLIESLEVFTLIKKANDQVTLPHLLQEFYSLKSTEPVGELYLKALEKSNIEDSQMLQKAYRTLCESMSVVLLVCAIGAISAPVSLDNIGTYANSLEERSSKGSIKISSSNDDRFYLSQKYLNYASVISAMFPHSLQPYTAVSVKYHVLLSQYYHYTLNPVKAYNEITSACNHLVFQIENLELQKKFLYKLQDGILHDDALINRLYWTCLKLECELRFEMSPHAPFSSITQITPPSSFFRIPDPFQESEHTRESIKIANNYDDQNTWYYFLTEIAVRKLENNILDEIYPVWSDHFNWDDINFTKEKIWKLTIKYSNHLDCIVNSLTPSIRDFVLSEKDPALIYESVKRKARRKKKIYIEEEKVPQVLEDYLVDEDLLHRAQSESVLFIKTRLLSAKMLLMRPLVYMYLHDHISFEEIIEAVLQVIATNQRKQSQEEISNHSETSHFASAPLSVDSGSEGSIYSSAAAFNLLNQTNEENGFNVSQFSSRFPPNMKNKVDDFGDLMEYAESNEESAANSMVNYEDVRKRILRWFVSGLISVPKLNIPKLGSFRHPGSAYYIRNLVLGVTMQFLMFMKTQGHVARMASPPMKTNPDNSTVDPAQIISQVFPKEHVKTALEHALLITDYWKEERKDCAIYGEYLRQCLNRL